MGNAETTPGTIAFVRSSVAYELATAKRHANKAREEIGNVAADALAGYARIDYLVRTEAQFQVWAMVDRSVAFFAEQEDITFEQFRADVLEAATERLITHNMGTSTSQAANAIATAELTAWQGAVRDLRAMTGTHR